MATWQEVLRKNFTSVEALSDFLELGPQGRKKLDLKPKFPLNLPYRLAAKIKKILP